MTLNLRSHREIHAELARPPNVKFLKTGLRLVGASGRERELLSHTMALTRRLMVIVAGREIFRGDNGSALESLAEMTQRPGRVSDLKRPGEMAKQIGEHLKGAIASFDFNRLGDLSEIEKQNIRKHLGSVAAYLEERGNLLEKNKWRASDR